MNPFGVLLVAVGLAMDAFAVSLGVGTSGQARTARPILRLSFHLGLFQGMMTLLGWLAGATIARYISGIDHWVALALLVYVGGSMIRSGLSQDVEVQRDNPTKGKTLVMLSVATSIDALAVGLSLGMIDVNVVGASLVIACVTLGFSLAGMLAGMQLGVKFGKRMEVLGGLILIGIGLNILITHLIK
jgi:manganese efflux pump family protein